MVGLACVWSWVPRCRGADAWQFFAVFFAAAAFCTAALQWFGVLPEFWQQSVVMIVSASLAMLVFRKRWRLLSAVQHIEVEDSLIGQRVRASVDITPSGSGTVQFRGSSWRVRNVGELAIGAQQYCCITAQDGIILHVKAEVQK